MIESLAVRQSDERPVQSADGRHWRAVCLVALGAFLGLGLAAYAAGILPGDLDVRRELLIEDNSPVRAFAWWVNLGGTWKVLLPVSLVIAALSRAARHHWWLWVAVFLASGALEHIFKFLVGRPRPSGFSLGFPSGHTTAAAAFAVLAVYLLSRGGLRPAARLSLQIFAIAMMILVGWARIVLRAHWPTDVLGGLLLGTACAAAAAWWVSTRETAHHHGNAS